jgi:hypothetical protein
MRIPCRPGLLPVLACVAVLTALLLGSGATPAAAQGQQYFWKWSDGDLSRSRSFAGSHFASPDDLPRLVVTATPAAPRHRVLLQFREGTRWRTDDSAVTSAGGTAELALNPFCPDGRWCHRRFAYRLVVDGVVAGLSVTFRS